MTERASLVRQDESASVRLLLVDDDPVSRTLLARQLLRHGFLVRQAPDGPGGLEIARSGWANAVLLDYLMPGMTGVEVMPQLRDHPTTADLPIILLTALDDVDTLVEAFEHGVDDYVTKPAHPDEVRVRLLRLLRQAERRARLAEAATVDALTGLLNRRSVDETGVRLLGEAARDGGDLACLIFDIDHFKHINDTAGHATGDTVLVEVARRLRAGVRQADPVGRYGGEEFVALLPAAGPLTACKVAERVRQIVAATPVDTAGGPIRVTISGGIAAPPTHHLNRWDALLAQADAALYQAKAAGRNRIVLSSQ